MSGEDSKWQADQLYEMTDPLAERTRKISGCTLRSIGHIARTQRIKDNDAEYVDPLDMLAELREDNMTLVGRLRDVHDVVDECRASWIDETERRARFLFESSRSRQGELPFRQQAVYQPAWVEEGITRPQNPIRLSFDLLNQCALEHMAASSRAFRRQSRGPARWSKRELLLR